MQQDYLFQTRRRRPRRWLGFLLKLIIFFALGFAAYWGIQRFSQSKTDQNDDLLPLPPIEQTRPVSVIKDRDPIIAIAEPPPVDAPEIVPATAPEKISKTSETISKIDAPPAQTEWVEYTIQQGDTLIGLFKRQGLNAELLNRIISSSKTAKQLNRIRPGQRIKFKLNEQGQLAELILVQDHLHSLHIQKTEAGYQAQSLQKPVDKRLRAISGTISSTFFAAAKKAGLSDRKAMNLVQLFRWDIDFAREIQAGDQFRVVYEEHYLEGKKIKDGPILAAEFINRGKTYTVVRYTNKEGVTAYYDEQGRTKKKAFIRTPVKFTRISSKFTKKRWHPVLKRWRSHKGVDYAAPRGTPVKAAGDGKVAFIGKKGGYGKVIFLQHGEKYTTVYGHLSRFARGLKKGSRVKQGQIIAYVGATGLASGPHLHYEFRINGVHQDPLKVKLPNTLELDPKERQRFKKLTANAVAQLNQLRAGQMLASSKTP